MEQINKYILWIILDYCDITTIYNTGLLTKKLREFVIQYICKHKYLHLNEYTKMHGLYIKKLYIPSYISNYNNLIHYPNITHLSIYNFDETVAKYFVNIEHLKCENFNGYKNKFNKLKEICVTDYILLDELIMCAPNVEIIRGKLKTDKTLVCPNIKKLYIHNISIDQHKFLLQNCKFDNIIELKLYNIFCNSGYVININNYPKLQKLYDLDNKMFVISPLLHTNIKSIKCGKYSHDFCDKESMNLLLNAPNLKVLKLRYINKSLYDFCKNNNLLVKLKGRCDFVQDYSKIQLHIHEFSTESIFFKTQICCPYGIYDGNNNNIQYKNVTYLNYYHFRPIIMSNLAETFPNLYALKLNYLPDVKDMIIDKINNFKQLNKIKLGGIHVNNLYNLAIHISSLSHICLKAISFVGKVKKMSKCTNIKTLHLHISYNKKSMIKVLNIIKDCFINIENILLPLLNTYKNNINLRWIVDNFNNIKTVVYKTDCNIKKYFPKVILGCEKIIKYIIIDNNTLYYNLDNFLKFHCGYRYMKITIYLMR